MDGVFELVNLVLLADWRFGEAYQALIHVLAFLNALHGFLPIVEGDLSCLAFTCALSRPK